LLNNEGEEGMKKLTLIKYRLKKYISRNYKLRKINIKKGAAVFLMLIGSGAIILCLPLWFWYLLLVVLLLILAYVFFRIYL